MLSGENIENSVIPNILDKMLASSCIGCGLPKRYGDRLDREFIFGSSKNYCFQVCIPGKYVPVFELRIGKDLADKFQRFRMVLIDLEEQSARA